MQASMYQYCMKTSEAIVCLAGSSVGMDNDSIVLVTIEGCHEIQDEEKGVQGNLTQDLLFDSSAFVQDLNFLVSCVKIAMLDIVKPHLYKKS